MNVTRANLPFGSTAGSIQVQLGEAGEVAPVSISVEIRVEMLNNVEMPQNVEMLKHVEMLENVEMSQHAEISTQV